MTLVLTTKMTIGMVICVIGLMVITYFAGVTAGIHWYRNKIINNWGKEDFILTDAEKEEIKKANAKRKSFKVEEEE